MDILNFISWIKGGRVVNTVDPAKTLLPVGLKDNRRDDAYLAGAISVEDLVTQLTPTPTYKVFTALLTQSGGDDPNSIETGLLTIGVTYEIFNDSPGMDFTNVGSPNNNLGTKFIAIGTTPNSWGINETSPGSATLIYNPGAPVATVLENTIGNIWFSYDDLGVYSTLSDGLFTENKTIISFMPSIYIESPSDIYNFTGYPNNVNQITLTSFLNYNQEDNKFGGYAQTAIEIRVYN